MGQPHSNPGQLSITAPHSQGQATEDDQRILRGLRAGIEEAYEELIDRFQQPVYGMVYRLLGNPTDASDVVQDVFLKVFRNVHSFREQSSLRTWVYRIAVNEAYNHRRWFSRHCKNEVSLEHGATEDHCCPLPPDPGRSPYHLTLDSEKRALIEQALTRINPDFRTAVVLRDIENLSYEEIGDILQINIGTVKSRILRGREALRRELTHRVDPRFQQAFV